jgi:hypothetical protein
VIHFRAVKPYQVETPGGGGGGGGGGNGGCKDLASFRANAQQQFSRAVGGQACAGCHLAGNARSALDLTGINAADDATVLTVCNQIKTRVNLITPDQSGVFLAPDPANTNHPFQFTPAQLATFKNGPTGTGVVGWINAEKVAP